MSEAGNDDITLEVAGAAWKGWMSIRITRRLEGCPSDFELGLTEDFPGQHGIFVQSGDACVVRIGPDVVVTGYCDRIIRTMDAQTHDVRIIGRGKCQDLVDASAEWPGCQISNTNVLDLANKLAAPYGIKAVALNNPSLGQLPTFNIALTETPYSIIEEAARYFGVLAYEMADGNLAIAAVGKTRAASGFVENENVQKAEYTDAADQRFSLYDAFLMNMQVLGDLGNGGNLKASVPDPNVRRHRMHAIIAEAPAGGQQTAEKRALWEAARRAGRGTQIKVTADSWRDAGGTLWTPNTLAPVSLLSLTIPSEMFCIGEVTYRLDNRMGRVAEVTLMPPAAFAPEPILLQPLIPDLASAVAK